MEIRDIKWFFQRGRRGYADCDFWDLHSYFSEIMPRLLRKMKEGYGCPSELYDESNKNNECHNWHEALEEMAQGFEAAQFLDKMKFHKWVPRKEGGATLEMDYEAQENARRKLEKGLTLFAKHYLNLWD